MAITQRLLIRTARELHQRLAKPGYPPAIELPENEWRQLQKILGRRQQAIIRHWPVARRHCDAAAIQAIDALVANLGTMRNRLAADEPPPECSYREVYEDVAALSGEFADVTPDFTRKTLSVQTEPITLDGTSLGEFRIVVSWQSLSRDNFSYRIEPVDNQYTHDGSTSHPHVSGGHLCEGNGGYALDRATQQGRLFDFLLIIRSILETYNHESAYVSLDEWGGIRCQQCNEATAANDSSYCHECSDWLCDDCGSICHGCADLYCDRCVSCCEQCEVSSCEDCITNCHDCGQSCCSDCHTEGTCHACINEKQEDEAQQDDSPAGVHTSQLGEACLSA